MPLLLSPRLLSVLSFFAASPGSEAGPDFLLAATLNLEEDDDDDEAEDEVVEEAEAPCEGTSTPSASCQFSAMKLPSSTVVMPHREQKSSSERSPCLCR